MSSALSLVHGGDPAQAGDTSRALQTKLAA